VLVLILSLASQGFAQLDLESPDLGSPPQAEPQGSFANINLGGLLDVRYMSVGNRAPGMMIHVDELVVTANIGDNISILAEQLLPTSRLSGADDVIQDDHGFVYAIIANIPLAPSGTAFKVGRFRFKWGVDAALDGPSNMLYPLVRKNLGFVTDRGLELSGFFGPVDYALGLADGPEYVDSVLIDTAGNEVGTIRKNVPNNSLPLLLRLGTNAGFSRSFRLALSGFYGRSWPYMNGMAAMPNERLRVQMPGGMPDYSQLAGKLKGAVDATVKFRKLAVSLEFSLGRDRFADGSEAMTRGYFVRADYTIKPQKLAVEAQYDRFADGMAMTDEQSVGGAVKLFVHEQAYLRLGYLYNRLGGTMRDNAAFSQLALSF
jgi:hypothetical protein